MLDGEFSAAGLLVVVYTGGVGDGREGQLRWANDVFGKRTQASPTYLSSLVTIPCSLIGLERWCAFELA